MLLGKMTFSVTSSLLLLFSMHVLVMNISDKESFPDGWSMFTVTQIFCAKFIFKILHIHTLPLMTKWSLGGPFSSPVYGDYTLICKRAIALLPFLTYSDLDKL